MLPWLQAKGYPETRKTMCRSIKQLRRPDTRPTEEEMQAAALQYVRKVSGYRAPSRANQEAFEEAVAEVTDATRRLLERLPAAHAERQGADQGEQVAR
jgi:hypothetical protein